MTIYYVDPEGSAGTGDGTSFANRAEKIQTIKDNQTVAAGDEIRIKASTAPTSLGTGKVKKYPIDRNYNGRTFDLDTISTTAGATTWTLSDHDLTTGDAVWVFRYGGSSHSTTGAGRPNGEYNVTVVDSDTFKLDEYVGVSGASYSGMRLVNVTQAQIYLNTDGITKFISGGNDYDNLNNERTAWTASTNVTANLKFSWSAWSSSSMQMHKPPYSDEIAIGSSFGTGLVAYKQLKTTLDLSNYQQLNFYCQQTSGTKIEGNLSVRLCSDTAGQTSVATFPINWGQNQSRNPSTSYHWNPMVIDLGSAMPSSVQSIAIYCDTDEGAQTLRVSDFFASKAPTAADCLTLKSLVSLDTTADPMWFTVGNVYNNRLMLTMGNAMRGVFPITYYASCGVYFSATNASAPIKVVQPITTNYTRYDTGVMPSNDWNDNINDIGSSAFTGSSGNNVVISGGWNRTDMSTQGTGSAGITFLDGLTQQGIWLDVNGHSYLTIEKLWGVRYYNFIKMDTNSAGREFDFGFGHLYNNGISGDFKKCKIKFTQLYRYPYVDLGNPDTGYSPSDFSFIGYGGGGVQTAGIYFASQTSTITIGEVTMYAHGDKGVYFTSSDNTTVNTMNVGYNNNYQSQFDCYLNESTNITIGTLNAYGSYNAIRANRSDFTINNINHTNWPNNKAHGYTTTSAHAISGAQNTVVSNVLGGSVEAPVWSYTGSKLRLYNLVFDFSGTEIRVYQDGGAIESAQHDGVSGNVLTQFYGHSIEKETSTVQAAGGTAWKQTITSDSLSSNPKAFDVAKIAVNANAQVTLSVYCYRNSSSTYGGIHIKANALLGITSAVRGYTSGSTGAWEQVSINCTPTAAGILDVQLGGYRQGGDGIIYYDTFSASQA